MASPAEKSPGAVANLLAEDHRCRRLSRSSRDNGNGWNGGQSSQGWENGNGYGANGYDRNYGNGSGRRLTRSYSNRMVCGVCAGIAEYFNWDPTIVRLIWVGASLLFGAGFMGLIAYFIVAVIMPEK